MRAYRIAMTEPGGPVYLCFDVTDQEAAIEKEIPLPDPKRFRPPAPLQADYDAIKEAAQLLASAQNPVILADYVGRNNDAVMSLVALADLLSIPVVDFGARLNFPNTHSLNLTGRNRELIANADVIMGLDMTDLYGALVRSDPDTHANVPATKPGCKVINVTLKDIVVRGWSQRLSRVSSRGSADGRQHPSFPPGAGRGNQKAGKIFQERRRRSAQSIGERSTKKCTRAGKPISKSAGTSGRSRRRALPGKFGKRSKKKTGCWSPGPFAAGRAGCGPGTNRGLFLGGYGGGGLGYGPAASVGASLPYRGTGKICVNLQRDGEMLYTPSALWTAANTGVPLLTVMTNNRVYYNDVEHQEKVAIHRGRPVENKLVGMEMAKPPVDFANLARTFSVHGEGPITEPEQIRPAVERAIKVIKEEKRPALVDVYMQMV